MAESYIAFYECADKVEAAARKRGFTGANGESWHDFVEAEVDKFRVWKQFWVLEKAEAWLVSEIKEMKTVYGVATIRLQRPKINKCRYCVCGGIEQLHEYTVDETGITEDQPIESPCL